MTLVVQRVARGKKRKQTLAKDDAETYLEPSPSFAALDDRCSAIPERAPKATFEQRLRAPVACIAPLWRDWGVCAVALPEGAQ